ncbi:leucyl aminopeptidase family protein [Hymenobacter busanensis]|uniref:Leucyl aminopeptidase family protein n=1 Tax=Hymenobacter busanensis TaxID=2607656 RepID=A0A7L4ZV21_9BACT|nr:leucyl aminopeptidase family protein [Hymenobacter busanensis]KAA9339580.1 leucyl aminopeptidase family protein [Hymenobacter busanensis]QHJ06665.1 peptidase M17 [Hymenobacter busanensis]
MPLHLASAAALPQGPADTVVILPAGTTSLPPEVPLLPEAAQRYADEQLAAESKLFAVNLYTHRLYVVVVNEKKTADLTAEQLRRSGHQLHAKLVAAKVKALHIVDLTADKQAALPLAEGLYLTAYQFEGYKTDEKSKKPAALEQVTLVGAAEADVQQLDNLLQGVALARDLVNMPQNKLNATEFAEQMAAAGERAGFTTEILDFTHIESLRMGGLLAVNLGSPEPPTFTIMEWKPEGAKNAKPVVLVGKGVVFDTGGLSLKPTPASMDMMKCDMAGAAAMTGVMYALAKNQVPLHVIALVPATDNRPGGNALAPGDVITMHSGLTVEVLNTDAEGRLILADALSFAKKYQPELVIDAATLTGSAARAIGKEGIVAMGTADEEVMQQLARAGRRTHERVVEFPLWDEYAEHIKSDIADINNLGKAEAGAISAGKFLERFTEGYPWIHLDIAAPAFLTAPDNYRGKGGTGSAVRLLYTFLTSRA